MPKATTPDLPDSGFDRVASFYDPLARVVFGKAQQRAQVALLPFIPAGARVLIIGGGSGWILEQVLSHARPSAVLYLEASPAMLRRAQKRYQQLPHPQIQPDFIMGTEAALQPQEQFEVIITPFLLDLFPAQRLSQLMQKLHSTLAPGGRWLFADFLPEQQPAPLWQRLLLSSMYEFFGILSQVQARQLPDFQRHFAELPLQEIFSSSFYYRMIQAKVYTRL